MSFREDCGRRPRSVLLGQSRPVVMGAFPWVLECLFYRPDVELLRGLRILFDQVLRLERSFIVSDVSDASSISGSSKRHISVVGEPQ